MLNMAITKNSLALEISQDLSYDPLFLIEKENYQITKLDYHPHYPYLFEEQVRQYVISGDYQKYQELVSNMDSFFCGKIANSYAKEREYIAVLSITILLRYAIEAGVNPYEAYDINDTYLQKISACSNPEDYEHILKDSIRYIFQIVHRAKAASSSSILVEKCKSYVAQNLNKPFSVKDIAAHIGVSAAHLSATFSANEHITIKQFITHEKINAAKNMLKYSNYSISAIASYLNFSNQSYFSQIFLREVGISPNEYRRLNNRT